MDDGDPRAHAESVSRRPVRWPDDEAFLRGLYASTRAEELAPTGWSEAQQADFCNRQWDAQRAHYEAHYRGATHEVIEAGGMPAGRLYVARWEKEIRLVDLALRPEFRGRGIGTQLLRELAAEADAVGKALTVHVEQFNPARRLYERLGFELAEDKGVYLFLRRPPRGTG